jgi:hypothetical protein
VTLTNIGSFTFPTAIASGASYNVTVLTQPPGQTCTVSAGSGSIDAKGGAVSSVAVACTATVSVGGIVSRLASGAGVTLSDGVPSLPLTANGTFAFADVLTDGSTYAVTVTTQPAGQTCLLGNATGTVVAGVLAVAAVTCS